MGEEYNEKRINPPAWQHDYHVLKRLYQTLQNIVRTCIKNKNLAVLDYGCGTSPYRNLFEKISSKYTRVDIDRALDADYVISEDEKIPLKDYSQNLILSTQVLEHIKNPDFYLRECARLLGEKGLLILSTHGIWPYHAYPDDYNRWTRNGLERLIKKHGFTILKSYPILGPFAAVTQFEMLIIAQRLINLKILGKILLPLLSLSGNGLIWIEDKIIPPSKTSDSSLYVICAKKI